MTGLIDSHCHLDRLDNVPEALKVAQAHGVVGLTTIGTRLSEAQTQIDLTQFDSPDLRVWCTIGTHPDHVEDEPQVDLQTLVGLCNARNVIGIGESGLDYLHGQTAHARDKQAESFRLHIAAARQTGFPLVIHAREADASVIAILRQETEQGAFPFLLHCFASSLEVAKTAVELGGYISFSGLITFPKCEPIRQIAREIPESHLLVETDSPFLAPVPKRGQPNTPGYVIHTAKRLATERGLEFEQLAEITTRNFHRLFEQTQ